MKRKKKIFRSSMSYNKASMCGMEATLGASGIILPREENFRQGYSLPPNWLQMGSMWSSLNDPKFYKDINMQDVIPKEEDFIEVPFRLISATVVGAGTWKATDFTNAKVLKASTEKLVGKGVYKDHETDVDNWAGIVRGTKWTPETTQNGIKIPAGIDGILAIDAKTNPKLARGILLGSLYSNSVTVNFTWSMSHTFENEWDFYDKIGTIGSDGLMVRRIVEDIVDYHETSIVWLGADPFSKAISEDGELMNVDIGSVYEYAKLSYSKKHPHKASNLTEEQEKALIQESVANKKMTIDFGLDKNVLSLAQRQEIDSNKKQEQEMNKFMIAFIAAFGSQFKLTEGQEVDDETMAGFVKDLATKQEVDSYKTISDSVASLMKEVAPEQTDVSNFLTSHSFIAKDRLATLEGTEVSLATANEQVTQLTQERDTLAPMAALGTQHLTFKKSEAIRLYKATVGADKVNESVVEMFNAASADAVDGLLTQYTKGATEKFSGSCVDCGSHNFKFQSSFTGETETVEDGVSAPSFQALTEKYTAASMSIGRK